MDAFITRRGGAGGGLNFRVVGGTAQPAAPKENTIWVNTDAEIAGWSFSATKPSDPVEGMVWITYNITGGKIFNVLSSNAIMLCPVLAKQRISGAWVSKTIKIYQNGAWAAFLANPLVNGVPTSDFYNAGSSTTAGTFQSDITYHSFSSESLSMLVDGSRSYGFKTNKTFNLIGVSKITIDGYTQLANSSGASTSTTSAPLTVALYTHTGNVIASGTYYPRSYAAGWTPDEYFKITLDVSSKGSALESCYLNYYMTRNGNYKSITVFKNIIFE